MTEPKQSTVLPEGAVLQFNAAVATVVLNLPQPKNSFRGADLRCVSQLLHQALDQGARCVVLRGAGASFSAGWDLTSINPETDDPQALITELVAPFLKQLRELQVPTIAAIAGPALGFGFGLALCCDVCIAEESALLGSPFRNIGMLPDSGTHYLMLKRLGFARAAELIYTGRLLKGSEAAACGLVNRVVPNGSVANAAQELALELASGPTRAFALSKQVLLQGGDFDAMAQAEGAKLREVFATADLQEGIRAFQQRRKPQFSGR